MSIERIVLMGFIGFAALAVMPFVAWWTYRCFREARRRRALREIAHQCGAEFEDHVVGKLEELAHYRLFTGFRSAPPGQRMRNAVVRRFEDRTVTVFDYQWKGYDTGEDIDSTERWTVVHVLAGRLRLPRFDVRPNGLYLKLTSKLRSKIDIADHSEFARAYDLSCEEEAGTRRLFHRGVLDVITSAPHRFQIEGHDDGFILYTNPRKITVRSLLAALIGVADEGRLGPNDVPALIEFADALCTQLLEAATPTPPRDPREAIVSV